MILLKKFSVWALPLSKSLDEREFCCNWPPADKQPLLSLLQNDATAEFILCGSFLGRNWFKHSEANKNVYVSHGIEPKKRRQLIAAC